MWRPSGAHIRKRTEVKKKKLTVASERIRVDEGGVAGYYRGTITARNCIRGSVRICWAIAGACAVATATARLIAADIGLAVLALVSERYGEGDGEDNGHESTQADRQPYRTAIKRSGYQCRLERRGLLLLACSKKSGRLARGETFFVVFWTSRTFRT
jgi:hypothetical protein